MEYPTIAQPQYGFGPTMPMMPPVNSMPPGMMPPMNNMAPVTLAKGGEVEAENVRAQGRGNDSMLVHMTPREVAGLQALAMQGGGSLTINPRTGLPEAGFLENLLPTILGAALVIGSGGAIDPVTAGMIVGGGTTVATGDINRGLTAGLGAYGGGSLGGAMSAPATAAPGLTSSGSSSLTAPSVTDAGLMTSPYSPAYGTPITSQGLNEAALRSTTQGIGSTFTGATDPITSAARSAMGPVSDLYSVSAPAAGTGLAPSANTMSSFGTPQAQPSFIDRFAQSAAGTGTPSSLKTGLATTGLMIPFIREPGTYDYSAPPAQTQKSSYEGPYTPTERRVSYPTDDERRRTSEYMFFTPSNPVPFKRGGSVPQLEDGGFVLTKKAVDGLGKGSNKEGQQVASRGLGAIPIRGKGTGTSDSIKTSIDGKYPARISNGEAYVPRKEVKRRGGAQKFYDLMKKAERAAA